MSTFIHDLALNAPAIQLLAPVAVTASANGTGVDCKLFEGNVTGVLTVGAVTGTLPTFDLKFQESDSLASGFTDIPGSAVVQATATGVRTVSFLRSKRYVRHVITAGGTTPSFTAAILLIAQKKQV